MYTDGQTVNVPVVINKRKVYLLILDVLHTRNKLLMSPLLWSKDLRVIPKLGH